VPFAATGAILLQIVTGVPLGVASLIGVLMLIGIVVTNAIVLVDLVNQYRTKGLSAHDATVAGGGRRLRPILMTALATIFALTPMALGITGHGGFISQPLAIGGLISSTVLTLLVLPTLYNLVEGAKERRALRRGEKADAASLLVEPEPVLVGAGAGAALTRRELREREAGAGAAAAVAVAVPMIEEDPDIEMPIGDDSVAPAAGPERIADESTAAREHEEVEAFVPESVAEPDAAEQSRGTDPDDSDAGQSDAVPAAAPDETPEAAPGESADATGPGPDEDRDDDRDQR
jgi:hypothetical protein